MAIRIASLAFILVLIAAHAAGDLGGQLALPMSMFRDGDRAWVGYVLFGILLLIGLMHVRALIRRGKEEEAIIVGIAVGLLLFVAVTPSLDVLHVIASLILLGMLVYHCVKVFEQASPYLAGLFAIALLGVLAIGAVYGYGPMQKGLIVLIVLSVNVRHALLLREPGRPGRRRSARRDAVPKRIVYIEESPRVWSRRT